MKLDNPQRRQFLRGQTKTREKIRLPWVISDSLFVSRCTQCLECIDQCENKIIERDEDGFPEVNFSLGECSFCRKCVEHCKEPLFTAEALTHSGSLNKPRAKAFPIMINIGDKCLGKNQVFCQTCRDECQFGAINFSYFVDGKVSSIPQPSITQASCNHCGACISICPPNAISITFEKHNE